MRARLMKKELKACSTISNTIGFFQTHMDRGLTVNMLYEILDRKVLLIML